MASHNQQGTGKHPHKDTEEPYPHHHDQFTRGQGGEEGRDEPQARPESDTPESEDLKAREYRDKEGNVHHHTRTYMEQHGEKE